MTDQELYEALGIQHFESGGDVDEFGNEIVRLTAEEKRKQYDDALAAAQKEAEGKQPAVVGNEYTQQLYNDPTFNPGGSSDKGFDWTIDAEDFHKQFDPVFAESTGYQDVNGTDGPVLNIASGQSTGVHGRGSSASILRKGEVTINGMTKADYDAKYKNPVLMGDKAFEAPEWEDTGAPVVNDRDRYTIVTDASKLLGRDDAGRSATVTYVEENGKMVPIDAPLIEDYYHRPATFWNGMGQFAGLVGAAYLGPMMAGQGGVAGSMGVAPGAMATAINTGTGAMVSNAAVQGANTGKIDPNKVVDAGAKGFVLGGAGHYLSNSTALKELPSYLQKPVVSASTTFASTGDINKSLASFIGAGVGQTVDGLSRMAAKESGYDFDKLSPEAQQAIRATVSGTLQGKKPEQIGADLLQIGFNAAKKTVSDVVSSAFKTEPYRYSTESGEKPDVTGDPDESQRPITSDFSLSGNSRGPGARGTLTTSTLDDPQYNLNIVDETHTSSGDLGLTLNNVPKNPSLTSMGGGQGLTVPVEGGSVGSQGFASDKAPLALGDPNSWINPTNAVHPVNDVTGSNSSKNNTSGTPTPKSKTGGSGSGIQSLESPLADIPLMDLDVQSLDELLESLRSRGSQRSAQKKPVVAAEGGSIDELIEYLRS